MQAEEIELLKRCHTALRMYSSLFRKPHADGSYQTYPSGEDLLKDLGRFLSEKQGVKPSDRGHQWFNLWDENIPSGGWPDCNGRIYVEFPADPDDGFNSSGPCGGPICKTCGYHYCEHCHPDGPEEECEGETSLDSPA